MSNSRFLIVMTKGTSNMQTSDFFSKPYQNQETEKRIQSFWTQNNFYKSTPNPKKKPFTIVMPPPNITGDLTMGHMMYTIQDILIRWHRALGEEACWIPGIDHASIATESKVTKTLQEKGISKKEIGREEFLKHVWKWKEEYGEKIVDALKNLGISCDWSRMVFTMDEKYSRSVLKAIVHLYKDGLIYKNYRLVNWCPVSQSVISDEEVYFQEKQGSLWHIQYPLEKNPNEFLVVATTRPETLFGDLAVAVNPKDARYLKYIGQNVILPICNRVIPIIADDYVDMEFGTGVVKITPAHDRNDFDVGKRHNLGLLNIMNPDASLNENVPAEYQKLDRFVARKKLVKELEEKKYLNKITPHPLNLGMSERGHVPIEYYLSEQWYIKMDKLAELTLHATRSGKLKLIPNYQEKTWEHWLTNIQDWCISRQLWWGHRLPMYICQKCFHINCEIDKPKFCEKCQHENLIQDEDVLDTWASSWIWPFGVHNWENPNETEIKDLEYYYPTNILITGGDIIFFWVARMVMAGEYFLKQVPFSKCYFTPIVRDKNGKKMSKSLGNSPDIQKIRDKYGTDALRFSLMNQMYEGQDIFWKDESCEIGKNFANKIWNSTRFLCMNAEKINVSAENIYFENLQELKLNSPLLSWIQSEFYQMVSVMHKALEGLQFSTMTSSIYEFVWMIFCDWFIELAKPQLNSPSHSAESPQVDESTENSKNLLQCALAIFDGVLRLLHPIMPFITEEIWQNIHPQQKSKTIGNLLLPLENENLISEKSISSMRLIQNIVTQVRGIRGRFNIHPATELHVYTSESQNIFANMKFELEYLSKAIFHFEQSHTGFSAPILVQDKNFFVVLEGLVDKAAEKERLQKRIEKIQGLLAGLNAKLNQDQFVKGAPAHILEGARQQKVENEHELELLKSSLNLLT